MGFDIMVFGCYIYIQVTKNWILPIFNRLYSIKMLGLVIYLNGYKDNNIWLTCNLLMAEILDFENLEQTLSRSLDRLILQLGECSNKHVVKCVI